MGYRLGVDLGTTFTSAAVFSSGWPTMVGLGNNAMQTPSVLYLKPDGEFLVGEAAERLAAAEPDRVAREFKRRLGDNVPLLVAGSPYSPQALEARLLAWVVDQVTREQGAPPDALTLTRPANWGPFKQDLFGQAIRLADVTNADVCTEPVAAATLYAARNVVSVGDAVAVYDLGGGTFDTAILRMGASGLEVLGQPEGIEHLGGIDFDEAIFHHVLGSLDESTLTEGNDLTEGLARLRRDCVEGKEALSSDTETVIPVSLPGLVTSVRVVRDEFEDMIRPAISETVAAMRRAIESAELQPGDLSAIILTGGSSRIPLVSQALGKAFDRPLALDTHPKHDVALGAAVYGVTLPANASPGVIIPPVNPPDEAPGPPKPSGGGNEPAKAVEPGQPEPHRPGLRRAKLAGAALVLVALLVALGLVIRSNLGSSNDEAGGDPSTTATSPVQTTTTTPTTTTTTPPQNPVRLPPQTLLITKNRKTGVTMVSVDSSAPDDRLSRIAISKASLADGKSWLPTISPDRRQFIYLVAPTQNPEGFELWIRPTRNDAESTAAARHIVIDEPSCSAKGPPAFDPEGRLLAVACADGSLRVVDLTGHVTQTLLSGGVTGNPTWTDQGTIIFGCEADSPCDPDPTKHPQKLWSVNAADGTDLKQITFNTGFDSHQDWSAATGRLLFLRSFGPDAVPHSVLYVSKADGSGFEMVPGTEDAQAFSWSPDGKSIAFTRKGEDGSSLFVIAIDGGTPVPIPLGKGNLGAPAWDTR